MLSRFALTTFVIIALAVSVFTIEQACQQRTDVATTQINSTQDGGVFYELLTSSTNTSNAHSICEDFGHLQNLVTRNPPDQTIKHQLRVTLTRPPGYTQYSGRVRVGNRIYNLVFATAAFNMWVDSSVRPRIDPSKVGTLGDRVNAPAFDNLFGSVVRGWLYRNTVEIGGLEIPDIPFASTRLESRFGKVGHGVIPFPFEEYRTRLRYPSFWMSPETKLERNVIAFSHRLTLGEVHIGMIENVYVGDIEYHPCAVSSFWMTKKAKIRVKSTSVGLEDETIIFDTASQYIRGPADAVHEIYKSIPESQKLEDGLYGYPCDITPPAITIQLRDRGREWPIEPYLFSRWGTRPNPTHPAEHPVHPTDPDHSKLCIGLFAAHTQHTVIEPKAKSAPQARTAMPELTAKSWAMGHPFLVGKYLVLDRDTKQIGVAELPSLSPYLYHHPAGAPHGNI
ncbi:aspartic peptidase domain-containing protein [Amanita rubescens]|nr:aspartic peptidase domain-containing protein [Amanita rubescens]